MEEIEGVKQRNMGCLGGEEKEWNGKKLKGEGDGEREREGENFIIGFSDILTSPLMDFPWNRGG